MEVASCIGLGYIAGMINPSYIIGKIKGVDVKKEGSGNAGGSNALILMGKLIGAFCMLFDIFKAFAIIKLCEYLFPDFKQALPVCGVSCILGHVFPVYLKFKGGKGLACLGGLVLAFSAPVFGIFIGAELILALILDYICVVPITASIAFPIVYGLMTDNTTGACILLIATAAMQYKHIENIRRIRLGHEMHLSYLWRGKKEADRVLRNMEKKD